MGEYAAEAMDAVSASNCCGRPVLATKLIREWLWRRGGSCLKTGQHSIFVIIRKIKRIAKIRIWDTLFIEDFIDSKEQYFHF